MENEGFRAQKSKKGPKMIKKHYLEKVFATRFQNVGNPYKTNGNKVFQKSFLRVENPYKTCLKLMKFKPKTENGLQNDQKSITFFSKSHMAFRHVEKPYKTNEKRGF